MTVIELAQRIDSAYDPTGETLISDYFGKDGRVREDHPAGDTLAEFIARELADTYDATATTEEQLETARDVMADAAEELNRVVDALS